MFYLLASGKDCVKVLLGFVRPEGVGVLRWIRGVSHSAPVSGHAWRWDARFMP
jgi:hypothetical protein